MTTRATILAIAGLLLLGMPPVSAQWPTTRDPTIPRAARDGPNLSAAAPKRSDGRPDLSGVWQVGQERLRNLANAGVEIPMQPWAEAVYKQRQSTFVRDIPSARCLPHGTPAQMLVRNVPFKIIHTDRVLVMLFELFADFRQIFTDGRALPTDANPTWFGYSVGRWEGDTLVVETTGFHDRKWLDLAGHPHSDALRTVERIRRVDVGRMEIQLTIDDPKAYRQPWTVTVPFELMPDAELIEYICENEKDQPHLVGR